MMLNVIDRILKAPLFRLGNQAITLLWMLQLLLVLVVVIILMQLLKWFLRDRLLVRFKISQGNREIISTLVSYSTGTLGLVVVFQVYGIDLTSLAVLLGALGVGIGFGLQELTKNLISGLVLLLEGKLQVGDFVEFDGLTGHIKEIAIRSTIIRTFDGGDVVVPNSSLTGSHVLNWSYKNFMGKIRLPIAVAYDSDPVLVTETLLDSAYMHTAVLHDPPPKVIFKGFGENALDFELWVWVNRIDQGIGIKSSLNFIIDYKFRCQKIKIPFPQRDLWLRNPEIWRSPSDQGSAFPREIDGMVPDEMAGTKFEPQLSARSIPLRQLLLQVPYFSTCSDLQLLEIIEAGYRQNLAASEILFQEGDSAQAIYVVLAGQIESVSCKLKQAIRTYSPGDLFGETPVMLGLPYIATARAVERTSLFAIPKQNLEQLLHSRPYLAEVFEEELMKEKEIYTPIRDQLQELGLLTADSSSQGFVTWVRDRLKNLFNL